MFKSVHQIEIMNQFSDYISRPTCALFRFAKMTLCYFCVGIIYDVIVSIEQCKDNRDHRSQGACAKFSTVGNLMAGTEMYESKSKIL